MNTLDWVILIFLGVGFVIGFTKGVIRQIFSLGGLVLGIVLGTLLYKPFAGMLQHVFSISDRTAFIVAFITILIVVPIVCGLLGRAFSKVVHAANLGFIDRLLGAALGSFNVLLIMGLIIKLLTITGYSDKINGNEKAQSKLYETVCNVSGFCLQWTWNKVQDTVEDFIPDFGGSEEHDKTENKKV